MRRLALTGLAALTLLGMPTTSATAAAAKIAPSQSLVTLDVPHTVYAKPAKDSKRVAYLRNTTPIMGDMSVFPVIGTREEDGEATWLRVRVPGRPNGRTGWIAASDTELHATTYHLVVEVARRRVLAYRKGRRVQTFTAIVGKGATPTPRGEFFIEEMVPLTSSDDGAPFALATSARSDVLMRFEGGIGQIALHGTHNLTGKMGTAVSHGCVRLNDTAIRWLARTMSPGVPITIRTR